METFFRRSYENPILVPRYEVEWDAQGAFNGCPVKDGKYTHMVYRAQSAPQSVGGVMMSLSTIGYARSTDGIHFPERRQLIVPSESWDQFGCEDPRITKLGDTFYIFYTALGGYPFNADNIKVAVATTKDFKKILSKHLVTPFNAKAMVLFPEKIGKQYAAMLTVHTDRPPTQICLALFDRIEDIWSKDYWDAWYGTLPAHLVGIRKSINDHMEVGAPPLKTKQGWLFFYSYIENYFSPPATFGVHAALLDLHNPAKVLGRSMEPLLTPKEEYERFGAVPNIVFPTGALINWRSLTLYYGAADTTTSIANLSVSALIKELLAPKQRVAQLQRFAGNPILRPEPTHPWEAKAVYNTAAIMINDVVHLIYRGQSPDNTSVFGYARSDDGYNISERWPEPVYVPRAPFEQKLIEGGNSGCEDPRLTRIGDVIYMLYTAYNGKDLPHIALTSILVSDFLAKRWKWATPVLISKMDADDKDAAVFPKLFNGKYGVFHRLDGNIWLDFVDELYAVWKKPLEGKVIMTPRTSMHDSRKIGIAGPPIETDDGWLLIYHGVSRRDDHHYHLRAALLDKKDPTKVLARTKDEILDTETAYERYGIVPNVVFSCGAVVKNGQLIVYYGAADTVIGVASMPLEELMQKLRSEKA